MDWRQRLEDILGTRPDLAAMEWGQMPSGDGSFGRSLPRTNPRSDRDLVAMAGHFGASLGKMPPDWLPVLRDAERVCACCETLQRCHAWLAGHRDQDSPRLFCPNAETLDQLAAAERRDGD
jgi:hypothetical protein